MKKMAIVIIVLCLLFPVVYASPVIWHNSPKTGTDIGDIFRLKFEILANETANYTITIDPGEKFAVITGNNSITLSIPENETRTFIFDMEIIKEIDDGKHLITYDASKHEEKFQSGKAYVRAGEQAPGFEIIAFISAIAIGLIIMWKRKHH